MLYVWGMKNPRRKSKRKEAVASIKELRIEGILGNDDTNLIEKNREEVQRLNRFGDRKAKETFIKEFELKNPDSKIQFELVRDSVIIPTINIPKRETTELFIVLGSGNDGRKTVYTMAPGRYMPRHPIPDQHKDPEGVLNEKTFQESADAWFDTVMLKG